MVCRATGRNERVARAALSLPHLVPPSRTGLGPPAQLTAWPAHRESPRPPPPSELVPDLGRRPTRTAGALVPAVAQQQPSSPGGRAALVPIHRTPGSVVIQLAVELEQHAILRDAPVELLRSGCEVPGPAPMRWPGPGPMRVPAPQPVPSSGPVGELGSTLAGHCPTPDGSPCRRSTSRTKRTSKVLSAPPARSLRMSRTRARRAHRCRPSSSARSRPGVVRRLRNAEASRLVISSDRPRSSRSIRPMRSMTVVSYAVRLGQVSTMRPTSEWRRTTPSCRAGRCWAGTRTWIGGPPRWSTCHRPDGAATSPCSTPAEGPSSAAASP